MEKILVVGEFYRHYKGGVYRIVGECTNAETDDHSVIYEDESGEVYVRTLNNFFSRVDFWDKSYRTVRFTWMDTRKNDIVIIGEEKIKMQEYFMSGPIITGPPKPKKKDTIKTPDGEDIEVGSGAVDFVRFKINAT